MSLCGAATQVGVLANHINGGTRVEESPTAQRTYPHQTGRQYSKRVTVPHVNTLFNSRSNHRTFVFPLNHRFFFYCAIRCDDYVKGEYNDLGL